jgi:pyruvate,water dikinase
MTTQTIGFAVPGPGQWALDRSHYPGGVTPISQWLMVEGMAAGMESVFAEIGVPAKRIEARFVNGFMYTRLIPLLGGDKPPTRLPPAFVLRLATRVHPEFRQRTKRATAALADRESLAVAERWQSTIRPRLVERNAAFQEFDLDGADDAALQRHVVELLDHLRTNVELHFYLHGHDLGPIARFVHAAAGWGLDPTAAVAALAGASPTTSLPLERLTRLRALVDAAGISVDDLDDIRAVSREADALLTEHLDLHGCVLATGYDLTAFTLAELPGVLLGTITTAALPAAHDHVRLADELRALVPAEHHEEFDERLADARAVMDMRDDNGPQTVEWPAGLLRRALLAAGRRLTNRGALLEPDHALDLTPDEARALFAGGLPSADEIGRRVASRRDSMGLDPPALLGPDEPTPPLDVMPKPLADIVGAVQTALTHLGMDGSHAVDPFVGVGIGTAAYTGTVRTAESADEAIEKLEPGDVLVVRATSPAFNAVLAVAGAVVTTDGGALSHAAVLARELGIPAVVGVRGALDLIDGSTVAVDPVAGRVSLV